MSKRKSVIDVGQEGTISENELVLEEDGEEETHELVDFEAEEREELEQSQQRQRGEDEDEEEDYANDEDDEIINQLRQQNTEMMVDSYDETDNNSAGDNRSFLDEEEEKELMERAEWPITYQMEKENDDSEAAPAVQQKGPSIEKLRKVAKKRAAGRLKRPNSSYFVFATRRRRALSAAPEKLSFKEVAQKISAEWNSMEQEEKTEFEAISAEEKTNYEKKLEELMEEEMQILAEDPSQALEGSKESIQGLRFSNLPMTTSLILPLARVKRTIKMDPVVKNVSKEATALVAKATEMFIAYMGIRGAQTAAMRGGKSIQEKDFIHMVQTNDLFDFLREDFPRRDGEDGGKGKSKSTNDANAISAEEKHAQHHDAKLTKAAAGTKSISGFFGGNKQEAASTEPFNLNEE